MRVRIHTVAGTALAAAGSLIALPAAAQGVDIGMDFAGVIGLTNVDIRTIITTVIRAALGFVGFILVLQIIFSGFRFMISGGSEESRTVATLGFRNNIIGFIIIMSASSITRFIVNAVVDATGGSIL